jgi:hypothetical protein
MGNKKLKIDNGKLIMVGFFYLAFSIFNSQFSIIHSAQYIPDSSISPAFTRDAEIVPTGEANGVCISNTGTPTPAITLCSTMDLTGKTVYIKLPEVTVATRPANHALVIVTDGTSGTDCTTGGGSTRVLCAWNGSAWASIGGGAGGGTGDVTDVLGTSNEICMTSSGGPQPVVGLCSVLALTGKTIQLGRLDLAGDITPTALAANTNDWNPTSLATASTIRFATTAIYSITGLQGGADGRLLTLYNVGSFATIFPNESSSSTAANRFAFGSDVIVGPNQGLIIQYDSVVSGGRWRALSTIVNPGASAYCADAGSTDTYACTLTPPITAYTIGAHYFFKANTANTGAATLALNGIASPLTIKKPVGGVTTDLVDNDIRAGQIVEVVYDGTNFQMVSQLGNAPGGLSGLATGCLSKAASSTTINDSTVCEDADSINSSKKIEVGDVSTNAVALKATGITGKVGIQAATLRKRNIGFIIGSDTGSALTNSDSQAAVYENQLAAFHVTSIKCRTDTGSSTINVARSGTNILSSNLVCTTSGATSTSFSSGIDAIAVGQLLDFVMVTAATSGTPKRISVTITAVIDSE